MKTAMWIGLLLMVGFAWGQSATSDQASNNKNHGQATVRGCVNIENGDYVLTQQDPANTYQLEKGERIKLRSYLGQRVEVTGKKSETIPTSEDALNGTAGSASPVTIRIKSIKTLSKTCDSR
jgi:hypothetical protein